MVVRGVEDAVDQEADVEVEVAVVEGVVAVDVEEDSEWRAHDQRIAMNVND